MFKFPNLQILKSFLRTLEKKQHHGTGDRQKKIKETVRLMDRKTAARKKEGNLAEHYGKLKRGLDGLRYQLTQRNNED